MSSLNSLSLLLVPLAMGWVAYFGSKGWRSARLGGAAAVGGFAGGPVALMAFGVLEGAGLGPRWESMADGLWSRAIVDAVMVGMVEEGAKLLPVVAIVLIHRKALRPRDGLLLAAFAGVGFAAAELAVLFWEGEVTAAEALARAAASPVSHALFAAPSGLGLAAWVVRARHLPFALGLTTSVGSHALYDLALARSALPNTLAAATVLALWIWLLVRTERRPARAAQTAQG